MLVFMALGGVAQALSVDIPTVLQGKKGVALASAVREHCRPERVLSQMYGEGGVWAAFRTTDADGDGHVVDRYSSERRLFNADGVSPTVGMLTDCIVNPSWWATDASAAEGVDFDLYNLIPCNSEVPGNKKMYPPGIVTNAAYDNGFWRSGIGSLSGVEVNFYEPADEYKGDFARAIMYVAVVYPCKLWSNLGENFFDDNSFPTLNGYSRELLLKWHRADPVSFLETRRNDAVEAIQGNRNPFVDYPDIAEHIWGDKADESFDIPDEPTPLKAVYSLKEARIHLISPYVPADAKWTVDGRSVGASFVETASLGVGVHELRFSSATKSGKLKIRIVE